jgi:hypothetical protein
LVMMEANGSIWSMKKAIAEAVCYETDFDSIKNVRSEDVQQLKNKC